jgi:DNA end-binding protein Ku
MAGSLIDMMSQSFDPTAYHDHYREALEKVIAAKANDIELPETAPVAIGPAQDLMEALRASVENMQSNKVIAIQSAGKQENASAESKNTGAKKEKDKEKEPKKGRRVG